MEPIIIVDNEYITMRYIPDSQMIYHIMHQPLPTSVLKEALNAGTEVLIQYEICKWLSDDRKNGPLSDELVGWALTDWGPRTIAGGWKYWANVVPTEVAAAGTLSPAIEAYFEMGLRMNVFDNLEEAMAWLDRQ